MITFYNTLSKKKESFEPMHRGKARLAGASAKRAGIYTCGPTVYGKVHIGNIRAYLTADMARRILEHEGFEVRHIKNITDVGHLTEDDVAQGDSGEDKIEKKSARRKKDPRRNCKIL
jgi:cysteinyl-tRNA synthetase